MKIGAELGGEKGETIEIDFDKIPQYDKGFLVEFDYEARNKLIKISATANISQVSEARNICKSYYASYIIEKFSGQI